MTRHPYLRPLELIVGVAVLLSVASIPVPRSSTQTSIPPLRAGAKARVENLHRETLAQANDVRALAEETRQLSELLRSRGLIPPDPSGSVALQSPVQSGPSSERVGRLATPR